MIGDKLMPEWLNKYLHMMEAQKQVKREKAQTVAAVEQSAKELRRAGDDLREALKEAVCKNERVRNGR